jgi:hypothetical protein
MLMQARGRVGRGDIVMYSFVTLVDRVGTCLWLRMSCLIGLRERCDGVAGVMFP